MARPKKNPSDRKKSMSISVTREEIERVQGVFKNFATGAIFLSNLMERLYEEGVIPDHIVKEEMDKLL